MTSAAIPGYLTKKEIEERYGRSHRSLTRDFSAAVRTHDESILPNLKLQTEDGVVRSGTEVTLDQIQDWSNKGLSPTWYVEGEWAAKRYGVRPTPAEDHRSEKPREEFIREGSAHTSPPDISQFIRRLEEQIKELQRDKERLYHELGIKNDQIQQANERTRESNVLMKQLQSLLANAQERALLPLPIQPVSETSAAAIRPEFEKSKPSAEPVAKKAAIVDKKIPIQPKQGSPRGKSKPMPAPKKTATMAHRSSQPKWYELPTVKKMFRRRS